MGAAPLEGGREENRSKISAGDAWSGLGLGQGVRAESARNPLCIHLDLSYSRHRKEPIKSRQSLE